MIIPNIALMVESVCVPLVQKGAAYMDEHHPGWVARIVPEDLSIGSPDYCICAQVFGGWALRPMDLSDGWKYGMDFPEKALEEAGIVNGGPDYWELVWRAIDVAWQDEIQWRLG